MPGTPTVPDGLTWPVDTDSPDIPRDIKSLADTTQAALIRLSDRINLSVPVAQQNMVTSALATFSLGGAESPVVGPATLLSSSPVALSGWTNEVGQAIKYTIPMDGWWTTEYAVQGGSNTTAVANARIMQRVTNGSQVRIQGFTLLPQVENGASMSTTFHVLAGNVIEYFVYHQSAQTLTFKCYMSWQFRSS